MGRHVIALLGVSGTIRARGVRRRYGIAHSDDEAGARSVVAEQLTSAPLPRAEGRDLRRREPWPLRAAKQLRELFSDNGPTEVVALTFIAQARFQEGRLFARFHALGDDPLSQVLPQTDHGAYDRRVIGVRGAVFYER